MLRQAWWVGLVGVFVASCVQTTPGELAKLAEGCVLNSDCASPLVCAFRRCHNACATDRDCPAGLHCRNVDKPLNVCLLDDELRCAGGKDRECPGLMVCGPDLVCRDPCKSDRDCLDEQLCVQGVCAAPKETTNGELPRSDDGGAVPCLYNSQCDAPLVCRGTCVRECLADRDCAQGANCVDGTCALVVVPDAGLPPGFGANCSFNSDCLSGLRCGPTGTCTVECVSARDCDTGFSECCLDFACARGAACTLNPPDAGASDGGSDGGVECINDLTCQDGVFCNGSERCLAGRCQPAVRSICDDGNPCSADSCSEALRTCSYMTIVPPDEDGRALPDGVRRHRG